MVMLASQFVSKLFISIGATGAFFTLRETYLYGNKVYSYHHFNLSQDADEAITKAITYSEHNAIALEYNKETMLSEMREITRSTAAERAERQARIERAEAERQAYIDKMIAEQTAMIDNGMFHTGRYYNKPFNSAPISYIKWIVNTTFDNSVMVHLQSKIKSLVDVGTLVAKEFDENAIVGTVGKRDTFHVTVTRCLQINGFYGVSYITIMKTDSNACMVSKGAFAANVGDTLTIKATVKEHSRYGDQMQTIVQRVAVQS